MLFKMEDLRRFRDIDSPNDIRGIFDGWGRDPEFGYMDWKSKLPTLEATNFFRAADPRYSEIFDHNSLFFKNAGFQSVISAVRNVISRIATAWGWFTNTLSPLLKIFTDTVEKIAEILATANAVMAGISLALDFLSFIPVVGWVIAVVKAIVEIILGVVRRIQAAAQAKRDATVRKQAMEYGLPVVSWNPDFDTMMCQYLQMQISEAYLNLEWCFMPRYPAKSASDFVAIQQKVNPNDDCYFGWLVYSNRFRTDTSGLTEQECQLDPSKCPGGLGFVPGTMNIHSAIQIQSKGGLSDLGEFFPVTRTVAGNLWNQALKGDSGMTFAIDADKCADAWADYVSAAYGFGTDVMGGWSKINSKSNFSKYRCTYCDYNIPGCTKKSHGKWLKVPGASHKQSWMQMLQDLFDWTTHNGSRQLNEDEWWETTRPVQAMRNLKERQIAMIQSRKCMYLDDSTNANGSHNPRFRAIRKGTDLHKLWGQCVAAMIESGDWKTIDYRDVIPGEEVDKALRTLLSNRYNTTPEKYFNMEASNVVGGMAGRASLGIQRPNWKSVLGDPKPPDPPTQFNLMRLKVPRAGSTGSTSSRRKKNKSNAPLALAAVAAAGLILTRK